MDGKSLVSCLYSFFSYSFFISPVFASVLSSLCVVLQVYGALTLPATGEESEDQGHDWLSWSWWACLSAMAKGVAMGPGCFFGCHNNPDTARR